MTRLTRHIRAPRARVYRALLDAEAVQHDLPTNTGKTSAQTVIGKLADLVETPE